MSKTLGTREKFFALNGLVCLVQALEGKYTTVDLRNETSVFGKISDVDVFMNISMTDAVFINGKGGKYKFDNYYVQSRNIRYVHIPEEIPIIGAIEQQLRKTVSSGRDKKPNEKKSFKLQRAAKKQQETVDFIAKLKEQRLQKDHGEKEKE